MVGFFYTLNYKNIFVSLLPFFVKHLNQDNNIVLCLVTKDDFNNCKKYFSPPVDVYRYILSPFPPHLTLLLLTLKYCVSFLFIVIFSDGN